MRPRRHNFVWLAMGVTAIAVISPRVVEAQTTITAESLTDDHVKKANDAKVEALYERKDAQRFWDPEKVPAGESKRQGGGYTALVVLALLHAGQSYQDPRLRDAVDYLSELEMQGTYAITTRAIMWAKLPPRFHDKLEVDARRLLDGFNERTGGWDYVPNPRANYHDNSIRQFGALALWEAAKRDVKFDPRVWQAIEDAFINLQRPDGGWNYKEDDPTTGSMTAAGLATLFITQDLLHAAESVKLGDQPTSKHQQAIDAGMKWMDKRFSAKSNPGKDSHFFYYLYGVERVGLASGYTRFGGRDWFREGAAEIINDLCKWDAVSSTISMKSGSGKVGDVAFAVMFLSRGRVPVAFNKLKFAGEWNNRPRDVANLSRWIGESSESALNWQIADLDAEPESWLDAAVLYVASNTALPWMKNANDVNAYVKSAREYSRKQATNALTADDAVPIAPKISELEKLRRYLDLGGMIFAANEGTLRQFAESIEDAGSMMYPQYEWRNLPDDHWAYAAHIPVKGRRPQLRGLSNGVRELIILSPGGDLPATFQLNDLKNAGFFHTLANVYFYASDMNRARPRLARHARSITSFTDAAAPTIVRAMHEGNWNPEPAALHVLAHTVLAERTVTVRILDHPLASIHQISPRPALVIVSGIEPQAFTQVQIAAVKAYIDSGGVILFETPGGRGKFTASVETMAAESFGGSIESLLQSAIITGEGLKTGTDLTQVEYRAFSMKSFGTRDTAPRLRGMTVNPLRGPQLLFSREDLSHALLDQPRWGVSGYSPKSARELLANIVQFSLNMYEAP